MKIAVRGRPSQGQDLSLPFALHHIKRLARVSESSLLCGCGQAKIVVGSSLSAGYRLIGASWCGVCRACSECVFVRFVSKVTAAVVWHLVVVSYKPGAAVGWHILGVYWCCMLGAVVQSRADGCTTAPRRLSRHPSLPTKYPRDLANSGFSTGWCVPRIDEICCAHRLCLGRVR